MISRAFNRQVTGFTDLGILSSAQSAKMRNCGLSRSGFHKQNRWFCESSWCPKCWRRRFRHILRAVNDAVVQPELKRRRGNSRGCRRKLRLALGITELVVDDPARLRPVLQSLARQERIRKIMRAGRFEDGIAFTVVSPEESRDAWRLRIRLSTLGLTERPVHLELPQPRSHAWHIDWRTKIKSHDLPKVGAGPLEDLLAIAYPYAAGMLDSSLPRALAESVSRARWKRVQPLGSWRDIVAYRPSWRPPRCKYRESCDPDLVVECDKMCNAKQKRFEETVCNRVLKQLGIAVTICRRLRREAREAASAVDGCTPEWLSNRLELPVVIRALRDFILEQPEAFPPPHWFERNRLEDWRGMDPLWDQLWLETLDRHIRHGAYGAVVFRPDWARKSIRRANRSGMSRMERIGRASGQVVIHNLLDVLQPECPSTVIRGWDATNRTETPIAAMQYLDDFMDLLRRVWHCDKLVQKLLQPDRSALRPHGTRECHRKILTNSSGPHAPSTHIGRTFSVRSSLTTPSLHRSR